MGQKTIKGSLELAKAIKRRRNELGFTIEEAASRAGVGTKTWSRYEAGASIRKDKGKGICKALNWRNLQGDEDAQDDPWNYDNYIDHKAWSSFLEEVFGKHVALSFAVGSDIILDNIDDDMGELASKPRGTHLGEIDFSHLADFLPPQFLTRCDYEFLYALRSAIKRFRRQAGAGGQIIAHSVLEELALYLIAEESEFLVDSMDIEDMDGDDWTEWVFDIFGDMDIITCLYSNMVLTEEDSYHFKHWLKEQFYTKGVSGS